MEGRRKYPRFATCDVCGQKFTCYRTAWLCSARCRQVVSRERAALSRRVRGEARR